MAKTCGECGGVGEVPETLPCKTCRGRGFITSLSGYPCL